MLLVPYLVKSVKHLGSQPEVKQMAMPVDGTEKIHDARRPAALVRHFAVLLVRLQTKKRRPRRTAHHSISLALLPAALRQCVELIKPLKICHG